MNEFEKDIYAVITKHFNIKEKELKKAYDSLNGFPTLFIALAVVECTSKISFKDIVKKMTKEIKRYV